MGTRAELGGKMNGPLHIGHSVQLLAVGELAKALGLDWEDTLKLLSRLRVPVSSAYGDESVVNLPTFEAAVFKDLAPEMPPDIVRMYQAVAALDHVVLTKVQLRKRLATYLRVMTRGPKGGQIKEG